MDLRKLSLDSALDKGRPKLLGALSSLVENPLLAGHVVKVASDAALLVNPRQRNLQSLESIDGEGAVPVG